MDIQFEELKTLVEKYSDYPLPFGDVTSLDIIDIDYEDIEVGKNIGWGCYGFPYTHSDETKKLVSEIKIGSTRSKSSREKQSKTVSGVNNHFYGKKHTAESRKIMSVKAKSRSLGGGNNNAKAVIYKNELFSCKKFLMEKYDISLYRVNSMIKSGEITYG